MTALLRDASSALKAVLASGVPTWSADLITVTLADGVTVFNWTNWDTDLTYAGTRYSSRGQWLSRTSWKVTNTMEVPTMTVNLLSLNDGFNGGASLKSQIHAGLLDGAKFLLKRAIMTAPGNVDALGAVSLFSGKVADLDLDGITAVLNIKGRVNDLDQYAPHNLYQVPCLHGFCDQNCTLSRATYTQTFAVGLTPTATFIPWASGAAPGNPLLYQNGILAITGGLAAGARRTIAKADSTGLTLAYPLAVVPAGGDAFTAMQACDKTLNSGSGQSCTDRGNTQHYRGYKNVPPPNTSY